MTESEILESAGIRDDAPGALHVGTHHDADPNLVGCAIALAGSALGLIAGWLPLWDPESHRRAHPGEPVPDQLLVGSPFGFGLLLVGVSVACAISVVVALGRRRTTQGPMIAGPVAILLAVLAGLSLALYGHFGAAHGTAGPGLGVHAGLVAGLVMLVGGLLICGFYRVETPIAASVAGVLVAGSAWLLTAMDSRAPIRGGAVVTDDGWLAWPNEGTTSEEKRMVGYDTCAAQSVESLARLLNQLNTGDTSEPFGLWTVATAGSVARGYARYFGDQEELYEGCLQGFRDKR